MNPLFAMMHKQNNSMGVIQNFIRGFTQFQQAFHGDPRQQVQELLNSGKVSQEEYDNAVKAANALQSIFNRRM